MNRLLYWAGHALIAFVQAMPLRLVARAGRASGMAAYYLDGRHRRVVSHNLQHCFGGQQSPESLKNLAREHFRRVGENYLCAVKTASMSAQDLAPHLEFTGTHHLLDKPGCPPLQSCVVAIGHFGNFELYARLQQVLPSYFCAATYRELKQPAMNRLMMELRSTSGCHFFERRRDGAALRTLLNKPGMILGLLADQSSHGVRIPFLGRDCNTSTAPAVLALRYECPLHTAICYREGLARWKVEFGPEIPTRLADQPRPVEDIMRDVNARLEQGVLRDPANWFWVHRRWKD